MQAVRHIGFRVDASPAIGSGHLMRCLTLADALVAAGEARCTFLCHADAGSLLDLVARHGHAVHRLRGAADAAESRAVLDGNPAHWLVVDHYGLDRRWESAMRGVCSRLMAIDDLGDRPHDCDLLLDQSLHDDAAALYRGRVPPHCDLLLGPSHVLLRPGFGAPATRAAPTAVRHVLVYFGGADVHDQAGMAIEALGTVADLTADVVLGVAHPHRAALHAASTRHPRIRLVDTVDDMAAAMARADLALGVCGMAAWERCAQQLASIVCITADNQRADARALHRLGAVECLGDATAMTPAIWADALGRAVADPMRLDRMARTAAGVVAGHQDNRRRLLQRMLSHAE